MLRWIIENWVSIVILLAVVSVVTLIIVKMIRDKKKGKSSCSCGCGGCGMKDICHRDKEYISVNIE